MKVTADAPLQFNTIISLDQVYSHRKYHMQLSQKYLFQTSVNERPYQESVEAMMLGDNCTCMASNYGCCFLNVEFSAHGFCHFFVIFILGYK